jgi:multidrug efflux system membrane fusion protein
MDERVDHSESRVESPPLSRVTTPVRRSRGRGLIILIGVIVLGLGLGWWLWPKHAAKPAGGNGPAKGAQTAPQPVGAATIDTGDIRIILDELGTVTSLDTVTVVTQISGQLTDVAFTEGQIVKKGDFLVQIDPRPYEAALEQAQGTLAHDQGLLDQAQADLKRFQILGRQDSIAQQQLDDQRYLVQQATGTVKTDQGLVDTAKLNLAYCHIISPVDGQVGLRQVDAGNYVQVGGASTIVVVTQMQPISVLFAVPEDNLTEIIKQVRSGATLTVEAYDRANNKLLASGTLSTLDNQIDTTTGTLKLRAMFDNPDELLYPNQFVNARLLVNTLKGTVRVPVPAVQRGEPGTYVYVVNANNTVSVRPIKVGPTDGGFMAVTSGLQVGERVVTDGTDRLRDGALVTIPPPPAKAAAAEPAGGQPGQATPPGQTAPPGQAQPGQAQPAQAQPAQAQPGQTQPAQAQPTQAQPAQAQHQHGQHSQSQTQ